MKVNDVDLSYSILNELPVLVMVIDENFDIVFWNNHLEQVTQIQSKDRVGFNLLDIYPRLKKNAFKNRIDSVLSGGPPCTLSYILHGYFIEIPTSNNNFQKQNTIIKYHSSSQRDRSYAIIMMTDVTDVYNQNQLIKIIKEDAIEQLKKNNDLLQNFAATVAHDIRTPLGSIKALSDLISEDVEVNEPFPEDCYEMLGMISESADRLNNLTADLLNYSSAKNVTVPEQPVDINSLINEIKFDLNSFIKEKNANLLVEENLPNILGWNFLLRQLFQNIIVNSIKYAREGVAPEVRIFSEIEDKYYAIILQDNGIGFTEDEAKLIFQPFKRLHGKHSVEGTGIGLATCARIMDQHNGSIEAFGNESCGAKFKLKFPKVISSD